MPQIKQKTVNGVLVTLNRYKHTGAGSWEYDYHIEANGKQVGPTYPNKRDAKELFDNVVQKARSGGEQAAWGRGGFDETIGARSAYSSSGGAYPSSGGGLDLDDVLYADDDRLPLFDEINELRGNPRDEDPY